jgi:hypothetical protein
MSVSESVEREVSVERGARAMPIQHRILVAVVLLQAGWLAYLCSRGWFYQDDFGYLSQAVHQPLTVGYLRQPINVHLAPGVRLIFWVLAHTSRLHYAPTIALRVILQAGATILLYRLITAVSESRSMALAITVIYGVSPLLVPGTLYLGASAQLLPAEIFVLIVYLAHLRHATSGSVRSSAVEGLAMLGAVAFWEKSGVTVLLLVILSLGWLSTGSIWHRIAGLFRDWRGWLLTLGPLVAFTAYYFTHNYASSVQSISFHAGAHLIWLQWGYSLWPAVIGAPWHWVSSGTTYISFAKPRLVTVILGQVAFGLFVIVGWYRSRWKGLLAWTLPIVAVVVGELLIAVGRYSTFGNLVAVQFDYVFDLALPVALAAALAFRGATPIAMASPRAESAVGSEAHPRLRLGACVALVALAVSSAVVSSVAWASRWHQNPAKTYVNNIVTGLQQIGPSANLFDSDVSLRVIPGISPDRSVSKLLSLTDAKVTYDSGSPQPQIVNNDGRIVPATFLSAAQQVAVANSFCPTLISGVTSQTVPFRPRVGANAYFLRIAYFERRPALVTITVKDANGKIVPVRGSPTVDFDQTLGVVFVPLQQGSPAEVSFTSTSEATNVCMSNVNVGEPVVAGP